MLSVTAGIPPCSSICIMSDVPERGNPETITISDIIPSLPWLGSAPNDRLAASEIDIERSSQTKASDHRHNEPVADPGFREASHDGPIDTPGLRTAGPRRTVGIID